MRRDRGSGAARAASRRHGRNASARDAHSSVSRLNCGDQTHPMFDRRSGRRARGVRGQSREALAVTKRARLGRSREKKRARSVFHVFSWNETRSRVRFGFWRRTRVSERHRLALDAGTHPSVLPVLPGRGGRWLTRHARLQHHRRALHEPLRANLRRPVAHGARSVRVYLPRSKNSRETTWARCWNVRLAARGSPDPRRRRDRTRARAHTPERDHFEVGEGSGKGVGRRAARNALRAACLTHTLCLDAKSCGRSARAKTNGSRLFTLSTK